MHPEGVARMPAVLNGDREGQLVGEGKRSNRDRAGYIAPSEGIQDALIFYT